MNYIDTPTEQIMLVLLCLSVIGNIVAAWVVPALTRQRDRWIAAHNRKSDQLDNAKRKLEEIQIKHKKISDGLSKLAEHYFPKEDNHDTNRTRNNDDAEQPDPTDDTGDDLDGNWSHLDRAAADTEAANGSEFFHQVVARHHMANPRGCGVTNCCFCRAAEKKKRGMENT